MVCNHTEGNIKVAFNDVDVPHIYQVFAEIVEYVIGRNCGVIGTCSVLNGAFRIS
jgi:hypothetical protein